jgi:hypothetical protein
MKRWHTRLRRLEHHAVASGILPPWATPRWQWLSEDAQLLAVERYCATLSESELEALITTLEAQAGATPCVTDRGVAQRARPDSAGARCGNCWPSSRRKARSI